MNLNKTIILGLITLAALIGFIFLERQVDDREIELITSNHELAEVVLHAPSRSSAIIREEMDRVEANQGSNHELEEKNGIAKWKDIYASRMSKAVITVTDKDLGWADDQQAVAEFVMLLDAKVRLLETDPRQFLTQENMKLYNSELATQAALLHDHGLLNSVAVDPGNSMDASNALMLRNLLQKIEVSEEPIEFSEFKKIRSPFLTSPYRLTSPRNESARRELALTHSTLFEKWSYATMEIQQLRHAAMEVARQEGLLPPHPNWMPAISPAYIRLQDEISYYEQELLKSYALILGAS